MAATPFYAHSQYRGKINPVQRNSHSPISKWGYKDLRGEWIIAPRFIGAYHFSNDGVAKVITRKDDYTIWGLNAPVQMGLIDLNGDVLVKYQFNISQKREDKKYVKAVKIVKKRETKGRYVPVNDRLAEIDNQIALKKQRQDSIRLARERADSIKTAQKAREDSLKKVRIDSIRLAQEAEADSIANVKRVADSVWSAQEHRINAMPVSGQGVSLKKVKVTGHGMLLSKDKISRQYTVRLDDFNRLFITYDGEARYRGELDVLKVIYESDWGLLSDDLFQSIEIVKATAEISRGARTQKYGVFSFLFTLNLDDLDKASTDEETVLTVLNSISQVERYITSFMRHYQAAAYLVEPLFQLKVGGREGIEVGIVDKQGKGASMEDVKRISNEARRKLAAQRVSGANK